MSLQLNAQQWLNTSEYFPNGNYRETGVNMTPLLTMFIPFNRSNPNVTGPYMIKFHRYKNNKFFRSSLGANLGDLFQDGTNSHLNMRFGWGKRRLLHERFAVLSTFDITIVAGDLNILGTKSENGAKFAVGPTWGMEYAINTKMTVGTETSLLIGIGIDAFSGFVFEFVPPVALYLNMRMPEKKRRRRR